MFQQDFIVDDENNTSQIDSLITIRERLRHTYACMFIYFFIIVLNSFVLIWEIMKGSDNFLIPTFEGIINIVFVFEITCDICYSPKVFFKRWVNWVDFVLMLLCIIFYIIFLSEDFKDEPVAVVNTVLIYFRYAIQLLRLCAFVFRNRKVQYLISQDKDTIVLIDQLDEDNNDKRITLEEL